MLERGLQVGFQGLQNRRTAAYYDVCEDSKVERNAENTLQGAFD